MQNVHLYGVFLNHWKNLGIFSKSRVWTIFIYVYMFVSSTYWYRIHIYIFTWPIPKKNMWFLLILWTTLVFKAIWGCRGQDSMVVGFTTTYAVSAYHHCCEFKPCSWWGVQDTPLCDKVCQLLVFSDTRISSTNKTDRHDITEILLKVALHTITPIQNISY